VEEFWPERIHRASFNPETSIQYFQPASPVVPPRRVRSTGPQARRGAACARSAFRLIGSEKVWDRGAALISRLRTFETEMLAEEENFAGLERINCGGDCLAAKLRSGNVHSADWEELLLPEIYEALEARRVRCAIRIPANELEDGAAGGGQGGISLWGIVPAGGLHCDEPGERQPGGGAVLQQAGHGGLPPCRWRRGRPDLPAKTGPRRQERRRGVHGSHRKEAACQFWNLEQAGTCVFWGARSLRAMNNCGLAG
jgi:hypothetical protein